MKRNRKIRSKIHEKRSERITLRAIPVLIKWMLSIVGYSFKLVAMIAKGPFAAIGQFGERFLSLFRFNITFKLTLGFAWIMFLFVSAINMFLTMGIRDKIYEGEMREFERQSLFIEEKINEDSGEGAKAIVKWLDGSGVEFAVIGKDSKIEYTNGFDGIKKIDMSTISSYRYRYFATGFPHWIYKTSDTSGASIVFRNDMSDSILMLREVSAASAAVSFFSYFIALSMARRMSKKHLKPLRIMTGKVMDISSSDLSTRLDIRGTKDELKDLAATFNNMMDDIEGSYERQRQFVSDASHELRTPIAVIKGYADMLSRWGKDDETILEESIDAIKDEADGMQSLVESLLFIARSDKNTLNIEKDLFSVSELMDEIVKQTRLIDKSHSIESNIEENCIVYGNAEKLKQAIRIFIDNSIRYTPSTGIISLSLRGTAGEVVISVADTGIGIAKEDIEHIFDRFYRADKSRTRLDDDKKSSGSGLGLAIAKIIVESHSGRIHVESRLEEGTCFTIVIPRKL